jgi:hypothetical protein
VKKGAKADLHQWATSIGVHRLGGTVAWGSANA